MSKSQAARRARAWLWLGAIIVTAGPAHANPLEPQPRGEEPYVERFVVSAQAEDGTFAHFHLQLHNAGVGDARSECRAVVVPPSQESWQRTERNGPGHWSYVLEPFPLLTVGSCYLRGGDALEVHAELDGVKLTLVLPAEPQRWRLRGNRIKMTGPDGAFWEKHILIPWAPARLAIRFPNGNERVVHGRGYADHTRATVLPYDIAKRWLRVRALVDERSLLLEARFDPEGNFANGWLWRQRAGDPVAIDEVTLQALETPEGLRWKARLSSADGDYRITVGDELDRWAPVEEMGVMGYVLRSLVGNPTTHTFRARVEAVDVGEQWDGVLEVHNENE